MLSPEALNLAARTYWRTVGIIVAPTILGLLLIQPITTRYAEHLRSLGFRAAFYFIVLGPVLLLPVLLAVWLLFFRG